VYCALTPGTHSEERQGLRPGGHRPANKRSVSAPRRAVILVDFAAPLAIFPVPIIARVLRRPLELLLGDGGAVPPRLVS
jgi:hypothetical protein